MNEDPYFLMTVMSLDLILSRDVQNLKILLESICLFEFSITILHQRVGFYEMGQDDQICRIGKILNFDKTPQKLITKNPMIHSHKNGAFLNSGISSLVNINFKIDNEFINITNFNDKLLLFENEQFRVKDCQVEGSRMNDHNKSRYGGIMKMNIGIGQKI